MLIYVSQMLIAPPFHHQRYSVSPPTLKQSFIKTGAPCQLPPKYRKKSHRLALLFIPHSTIFRKNSTLKALKYLTISTIYWIIST